MSRWREVSRVARYQLETVVLCQSRLESVWQLPAVPAAQARGEVGHRGRDLQGRKKSRNLMAVLR